MPGPPSPLPAALIFIGAGVMHFVRPKPFLRVVPPWVWSREQAVALSGAAEIAGGLSLLLPQTRAAASLGLVALLLAVSPVHIYMLQKPERFKPIPVWALWARLFIQPALIWWVWIVGRRG